MALPAPLTSESKDEARERIRNVPDFTSPQAKSPTPAPEKRPQSHAPITYTSGSRRGFGSGNSSHARPFRAGAFSTGFNPSAFPAICHVFRSAVIGNLSSSPWRRPQPGFWLAEPRSNRSVQDMLGPQPIALYGSPDDRRPTEQSRWGKAGVENSGRSFVRSSFRFFCI